MEPIDLRSDTVTRPTAAMREAMLRAEVGDDVFGEDPTVNALEERLAGLFGKEAGLFCPSGTMANQIAIHVHTRPGDEVVCDEGSHVYRYESGGTMANSGCSVHLIQGDRGRFTAAQVADALNDPTADWLARTRLVVIENTCNRGGGAVWDLTEVDRIRTLADARGLHMHLDGARIFNAMAVTGEAPGTWGSRFNTLSVCLSKGLGAPAGSLLLGDSVTIAEARRVRKRMGGGMRQVGVLAAAGLHALQHHVARLPDDHARAARLAVALDLLPWVKGVLPPVTNILVIQLASGIDATRMRSLFMERGVLVSVLGPDRLRLVTHLDVDDDAVERVIDILQDIEP